MHLGHLLVEHLQLLILTDSIFPHLVYCLHVHQHQMNLLLSRCLLEYEHSLLPPQQCPWDQKNPVMFLRTEKFLFQLGLNGLHVLDKLELLLHLLLGAT